MADEQKASLPNSVTPKRHLIDVLAIESLVETIIDSLPRPSIKDVIESRLPNGDVALRRLWTVVGSSDNKISVLHAQNVKSVFITANASPYQLRDKWEKHNIESHNSDENFPKYLQGIISETYSFLNTFSSLSPSDYFMYEISPRMISSEANENTIKKLQDEIISLNSQLADKKNEEKAIVNEKIDELQKTIDSLKKQNERFETDKAAENAWEKRLIESFVVLDKKVQHLDVDTKRARFDRNMYFVLMIVSVLSAIIWIWLFIKHTALNPSAEISRWLQIIPWYSPFVFIVGLFWVSIVQRNKATRHLITLNREQFKVKYTEGLMIATNKMSMTADEGAKKTSDLLDELARSYMNSNDIGDSHKIDIENDAPLDPDDVVKIINSIGSLVSKK